jgi:hypothetical protein
VRKQIELNNIPLCDHKTYIINKIEHIKQKLNDVINEEIETRRSIYENPQTDGADNI